MHGLNSPRDATRQLHQWKRVGTKAPTEISSPDAPGCAVVLVVSEWPRNGVVAPLSSGAAVCHHRLVLRKVCSNFMGEKEAADYLQLSVRTLQRYRDKGTLSYRKVSGKAGQMIAYDPAELDRLKQALAAQRVASAKPKPAGEAPPPRVTFGLSPEAYGELTREAKRFGMSVNEYARRLVREGLESTFQAEAAELRAEVKRLKTTTEQLKTDLERTRQDFAGGFEAVLEFSGVAPEDAKVWVVENVL